MVQSYIFGYPHGLSPERIEEKQFEDFLLQILGRRHYETRNQMRLMEAVIRILVNDLLK